MGLEKQTPDQLRSLHAMHMRNAAKSRAEAEEQESLAAEVMEEFMKRVEAAPRKVCDKCGAEKVVL